MYCRMCGQKIGDTDHFCHFCGASTGYTEPSAEMKEEIIFNPPYEDRAPDTEEEELKAFISENEIEEAQQEEVQKKEETAETEPEKNPEFAWNVYEFPTEKKKTEEVEFNWNMEEYGQPEPKHAEAAAFEEELFQEIRDDSSRIKEQNIDRFFTFSRKNEEFQELLDKEYEKFKMRTEPVGKAIELAPVAETAEEPPTEVDEEQQPAEVDEEQQMTETTAEQPLTETTAEQPADPAAEAAPEEELTAEIVPTTEIATTLTQVEVIRESGILEEEPELQESEIPEEPETPAADPRAEHISEMEQARAQYFAEDLIRDNESIRKKLAPGEPEQEKAEKTVEDYIKEEKEAEAFVETPAEEEEPAENDERAERVAEAYAAAALEEPENQTAIPLSGGIAVAEAPEETEKHKRSAGQIVLAVIAVILAIEIVILGIRYFAPDSSAAKAIGNAQTGIFSTVSGWFGGDESKTPENDSQDQDALPDDSEKTDQDSDQQEESQADDQTKAPAADPNPMADKNALVASQIGNNKNIDQVKANEALAWKQGTNYGLSDINNSKPITNNIWQAPETGDPVYYDRSVVGTIIAFDSQWIDYVNSGDKSVLALMKKDSEAYLKSVNYSKVGKIKETFRLLEIGEIRQGANGFYIWVHEEIGATENGKTSEMKYDWIYYLEPVDGQMKIVNYYHL